MTFFNVFRLAGRKKLLLLAGIMCGWGSLYSQTYQGTVRYDVRQDAPTRVVSSSSSGSSKYLRPISTGRAASSIFQLQNPPSFALKTNLLYWATATPNLGFEFGLGNKTSLEISGGYNPWGKDEEFGEDGALLNDDKKLKHWLVRPEFKYWFSGRFQGHYVGVQALYGDFDVHGYKVPSLLDKELYNEGQVYGGGISYGYHWIWGKHWGMEFSVGAGFLQLEYDKRSYALDEEEIIRSRKTYFGPISAGIKLVYIIK